MPAQFLYPNVGALALGAVVQDALAGSKIGLFKAAKVLTANTVKTDLTADECDFDGYAQKTVTAWLAPYIASDGGASISSGYEQWDFGPVEDPSVTNDVYGFWLEDADGNLIVAGTFASPITMGALGNSVPLSITLNYGRVG